MKIRRGTVITIKAGWADAGQVGVALAAPIMVGQEWVPVLWRDAEDPDFHKLAGLEPLVVRIPPAVKCDGNHAMPACADKECWNK